MYPKADISVDGTELHNVKISNRESLYAPKDVVAGTDDNGNKILMAPMERIEKISKGKASTVDISDVIVHKTIEADSFLGFYAIHSMAKMAYEWYCYVNNIEEFKEEYCEIVDYILGNKDGDFVDVIIDGNYYFAMDKLSEIGTNAFFQYDDVDGYRYVVFDFWKTISYRVRICKSPNECFHDVRSLLFELYLYHIVRRLTPTECARLQGFPDWWCDDLETENPTDEDISLWREIFQIYADAMGKKTKPKSDNQIRKWLQSPHSDSAEYKMWGNGVALPNVVFVLSGIAYYAQNRAE